MNSSYDWYKVFYTVADCGNITAAAGKLFISQPAVSQSIRQLESALGCELFVRTPKGVVLTAEGKILLQYISKGIESIQLGEKRLEAQLLLDSGEITIGASDMTLEFFLLPHLEEFHKLYPKIRISITNGPTPETVKKLDDDAIDFGVVSEPIRSISSGYSVIPVRKIEDIFIYGSSYRELLGTASSLKRLEELPLIMLEPNTSTRKYVDLYLSEAGVTVLPEFELATSSLIVQFAKRNLGVGCVVRDFAKDALDCGDVFELKLDKKIPKRSICVIRKNGIVSKASEKLLAMLMA